MKKKFNKILIVFLIAAAIFFIIWNNALKKNPQKVIAVVGEEKITYGDLQEAEKEYKTNLSKTDKDLLLDQIIQQKIAKIYAEKQGLFNNTEIKKEFDWQQKEKKKGFLINSLLDKLGKENVVLTDEYYQNYIKLTPFIRITSIFVPVENSDTTKAYGMIAEAFEELTSGNDFQKVRKKYMEKPYLGDEKGKEIIKESIIVSLLNDTIAVDTFSKPIKTRNGYYIIKRYEDPSFAEIKKQIKGELIQKKENEYLVNYVEDLKDKITINEKSLKRFIGNNQIDENTIIASWNNQNKTVSLREIQKYFDFFMTPEQIKNLTLPKLKNFVNQIALQEILYNLALEKEIDRSDNFNTKWQKT